MQQVIGIPRALLFYEYFPMWNTFFDYLGVKTIISPQTNKKILEDGLKNTVDEACLPVKLAMGHVKSLMDKADYIFLPRMVSLARAEYICPKFLGFPDMVRYSLPGVKIIDTKINLYHSGNSGKKTFQEIGKMFSNNPLKIHRAYRESCKSLKKYRETLIAKKIHPHQAINNIQWKNIELDNNPNRITIALIGHSYNINDSYINMNVIERLNINGVNVVTPQHLPEDVVRREAKVLPKKLFWTMGQHIIGSAFYYMQSPQISGIILMDSFACGLDSMTGELIERYMRKKVEMPFLRLTLDEHTGEAGVVTRLESFLDMIQRKAG